MDIRFHGRGGQGTVLAEPAVLEAAIRDAVPSHVEAGRAKNRRVDLVKK